MGFPRQRCDYALVRHSLLLPDVLGAHLALGGDTVGDYRSGMPFVIGTVL